MSLRCCKPGEMTPGLSVSTLLELTPHVEDGQRLVILRYRVGADAPTRVCEEVQVDGASLPLRQCFDVTGSRAFPQIETRQISVSPRDGVDSITIKVMLREVDQQNRPIGRRRSCTNVVQVTR